MKLHDATVLVVDDEPMLLEIFSIWLAGVGCRKVFTAANGEVALALMKSQSIDLLLTDVRMPVMDGVSLVRRLGELGKSIPSIVFVSGFGDIDRREMYGLGVEAFIAKPCDRKELLTVLQNAVEERSALWCTQMPTMPRQSMHVQANHVALITGIDTIGLGRGGFCVSYPQTLSPGKLAFDIVLAQPAIELVGQGYVRWSSRVEGKVGIEVAYLDPTCSDWLTKEIDSLAPRSFIPGS
jgi:CheY-like chemotaxis protein